MNKLLKHAQVGGMIGAILMTSIIIAFGATIYNTFALGWCGAMMLLAFMIANE